MKKTPENEIPNQSVSRDVVSESVKESEAPPKRDLLEPAPLSAEDLAIYARYTSELMKDPEYAAAEEYAAASNAAEAAINEQAAASDNSSTANLTLEELIQAFDQSHDSIIADIEAEIEQEDLRAQQEVSLPEVEINDDD